MVEVEPRRARPLLALTLAGLLAACGGPTPPSGGGPKLDVVVTLDASRAVTAVMPVEGGSLVAVAADGTVFALTIPPDALLSETTVTMTPVARVEGAPVEGASAHGVQLEPDGLRLFSAATLTVTPPGGDVAVPAAAFGYGGDGEGFHGHPLRPDPTDLTLDLLHFSGYVVYLGPALEVTAEASPLRPEAALEQRLHELFRAERDARLRGEPGDPRFGEALEELLSEHYQRAIAPLLPAIAADCGVAEARAPEVLAWVRLTHLLGLADAFAAEAQAVWDSVVAGLERCWEEVVEPCLDVEDGERLRRALELARAFALLGVDPAAHDPFDAALRCGQTWSGSITYVERGELVTRSDDPRATPESQRKRTFELTETLEVTGFVASGVEGNHRLSGVRSAQAAETLDSYFRYEHWDDCVTGGPEVLRYVDEYVEQTQLSGAVDGVEAEPVVHLHEDGTYSFYFAHTSLGLSGTMYRREYHVDNCSPGSEREDVESGPWSGGVQAGEPYELSGTVERGEDADRLAGSAEFTGVTEDGVETAVTITWDLTRSWE